MDNRKPFKLRSGNNTSFKMMGASPIKEYVSDAQRKAVWASKKDGGKGNPNKMKADSPLKVYTTAAKRLAKPFLKAGIKKKLAAATALERGYTMNQTYKAKDKDKSVGRKLAETLYDETIGFGFDLKDAFGAFTGLYEPDYNQTYPIIGGKRVGLVEEVRNEELSKLKK
tara:strand:+ start:620 stop:1126 length:507 start_codon:yes stop_codon:yes gene_type:complete